MSPSAARRLRAVFGALLLALLIGVGALVWAYSELHRPYADWTGERVDVDLAPGISAREMLRRLGEVGVLRRPGLLRLWLSLSGGGDSLHAGEYRFDRAASPLEVLERLEQGDVLLHEVTVPEGLDLEEIATRFDRHGFGPREALLEAFSDPTPIRDIDELAEDLEGYLFPETYRFPRGASAATVTAAMIQRFREAAGPNFAKRADAVGLSLREAVTLASMIERETSVPDERGRISRVFHNRLERRMRLQCDPTVIYAVKRAGREVDRLTYQDLEFDSPWNTYVVYGLPPGPIANPGKASLDAAVEPSPGSELYFVAAPEGGHRFSATLAAHLEAVADWRAYSRSSR